MAMGARTWHHALPITPIKFTLRHVRLDRGGYDSRGSYWGGGQPLFEYRDAGDDDTVRDFVRASDRNQAKLKVRQRYPLARFTR